MPPVAAPARAMAVEELLARVDDQAHCHGALPVAFKFVRMVPERTKNEISVCVCVRCKIALARTTNHIQDTSLLIYMYSSP